MKIIYILIVVLLLFMTISFQNSQANSKESLILAYQIPVALYNSQNVSTSDPFQQMIKLNESNYKGIIIYNGSFANFEFTYENGTVIPAWIESNNSGILLIWVKLISIQALSFLTIYLDIFSSNDNLLNSTGKVGIGEAPQLSSIYGEYDDGASVFNFYDNFAGTSLNTNKWTNNIANSGGTLTINNGMSYTRPSSGNNYPFIYSTSTFSAGIYETYGNIPSGGTSGSYVYAIFGLASSANINTNMVAVGNFGGFYGLQTSTSNGNVNTVSGLSGGMYIWQVWIPSSSPSIIYGSQNYGIQISSSTDMPTLPQSIIFEDQANSGINLGPFYWVRIRAYPPNSVMPNVSFGSIIKIPIENAKINIYTQIYALNISLPSSWGIYGYFNYSLYGKNYTIDISNITDKYFIDLNMSYRILIYNNTTLYYNLTLYAYKLQDYIALNSVNLKGKLNITTAQSNYNLTLNSSTIKFENVNNFYYFWNTYGYKVIGSILIISLFLFFISRLRRVK